MTVRTLVLRYSQYAFMRARVGGEGQHTLSDDRGAT